MDLNLQDGWDVLHDMLLLPRTRVRRHEKWLSQKLGQFDVEGRPFVRQLTLPFTSRFFLASMAVLARGISEYEPQLFGALPCTTAMGAPSMLLTGHRDPLTVRIIRQYDIQFGDWLYRADVLFSEGSPHFLKPKKGR